MPHIHSQPGQHDFTTSAFIVRLDGPEPALMLHMHRKLGRIFQFGGHIELHETPWQALLRELAEESGYQPDQLKILQPRELFTFSVPDCIQHPVPFYYNTHRYKKDEAHFHSEATHAVLAYEEPRGKIAEGESADIMLLTERQLRVLPEEKIYEATRQTGLYVLTQLINDWQPVPATDWSA